MPVIECGCGMVMSVSAEKPRTICIRCGRTDLTPLKRGVTNLKASERTPILSGSVGEMDYPFAIGNEAGMTLSALAVDCHI
jgi:hypothetical protein